MRRNFDSGQFVAQVGEQLVAAFTMARCATTPGLVGSAIEQPIRHRLEQILPRGIAVASGCVIDTSGHTSRQIDVIMYERDICPVFSVNDTPETTYIPCEGVVAVGEIKSKLGGKELRDAFEKVASVKQLKRDLGQEGADDPNSPTPRMAIRHYGQVSAGPVIDTRGYSRTFLNENVMGFVLTGEITTNRQTLVDRYANLVTEFGKSSLDILISLSDEFEIKPYDRQKNPRLFSWDGQELVPAVNQRSFASLIQWIYSAHHQVKTAEIEVFSKYFSDDSHKLSGLVDLVRPIRIDP